MMAESEKTGNIIRASHSRTGYLEEYIRQVASGHMLAARRLLLESLSGCPEQDWLECARALVLRRDSQTAISVLLAAMAAYPRSGDVSFALAGMYYQTANRHAEAEALLRDLLSQEPDHAAATFLLVRLLRDQGRMHAAALTARALFQSGNYEPALVIQAVELLDECGRKRDAAALCEKTIAAGSKDARLHAFAAMLLTQLGQFDLARKRYAFALDHSEYALEWNIALGLAGLQRYAENSHEDFALFQASLKQTNLSDQARASLLFALGKAHDDVGDYPLAAQYLRQANALKHSTLSWSRKPWRRGIDARIGRKAVPQRSAGSGDWTPVFIVGMPRSGTTVLAELLSRYPRVCNRGELEWMPRLEQQWLSARDSPAWLEDAALIYEVQIRQDDSKSEWFIDKQPQNYLCVDLILAMFPNARIVYCQRNDRDNALSLWSQCFVANAQGFSYDFSDIATVTQGCKRLMAHWQSLYPHSIHEVQYEHLASDPDACMASLARWLGLSGSVSHVADLENETSVISTASAWQARQRIYSNSVGRWRHYSAYLPELSRFPIR